MGTEAPGGAPDGPGGGGGGAADGSLGGGAKAPAAALRLGLEELSALNAARDFDDLGRRGGLPALAFAVGSDVSAGVRGADVQRQRSAYGSNAAEAVGGKSFLSLALEAARDPVVLLLVAAATVRSARAGWLAASWRRPRRPRPTSASQRTKNLPPLPFTHPLPPPPRTQVSTVLGAAVPEQRAEGGWVEGVAIWVAIAIVVLVGAGNDYAKDIKFRRAEFRVMPPPPPPRAPPQLADAPRSLLVPLPARTRKTKRATGS